LPDDHSNCDLVEQSCIRWESDLKAFLLGVLRDTHQVEDAFQRMVVKAIEAAGAVRPDSVRGWLFQIALNEARQIRRQPDTLRDVQLLTESPGRPQSVDSGLISQETLVIVKAAIDRLPDGQKQVMTQRLLLERSFAEIASSLDRPVGTVLTWMHRGLLKLRNDKTLKSFLETGR
jgi:RNA polymerase sigma-70 factor, ECF subfamily